MKKIQVILFIVAACLTTGSFSFAQKIEKRTGFLKDSTTQMPIVLASVTNLTTRETVMTSSAGKFLIAVPSINPSNVSPGAIEKISGSEALRLSGVSGIVPELAIGRLRSIASNCDAISDEISLIDLSIQKILYSFRKVFHII